MAMVEQWNDAMGKRVLIMPKGGGAVTVFEVRVMELSPSGHCVKLGWALHDPTWEFSDEYNIIEILPDPVTDSERMSDKIVLTPDAVDEAIAREMAEDERLERERRDRIARVIGATGARWPTYPDRERAARENGPTFDTHLGRIECYIDPEPQPEPGHEGRFGISDLSGPDIL